MTAMATSTSQPCKLSRIFTSLPLTCISHLSIPQGPVYHRTHKSNMANEIDPLSSGPYAVAIAHSKPLLTDSPAVSYDSQTTV